MADANLSLYIYSSETQQHELHIKPLQPESTHSHTFLILPLSLYAVLFPHQQFVFSLNHLAILFLSSPFAVIQDVDNASLEGQYQSFASLMEQRLAELFVLAGQQGTRFRRATAVGSYTVQVRDWRCSPQRMPRLTFSGRANSLRCTGLERESFNIPILKCCLILRRLMKALIQQSFGFISYSMNISWDANFDANFCWRLHDYLWSALDH